PWIGEARKVPRRIDERIHRVGFASRVFAALRTGNVPPGRMTIERIAGTVECHIVGQLDRQILDRYRDDAAGFAMNDRDRAAPIALTRNTPVAQAIIDLALADRMIAARGIFQTRRDLFFRLRYGETIEKAR